MIIKSSCALIQNCPPIVLIVESRMIDRFRAHGPVPFKDTSHWVSFLDLSYPNITQMHVSNQDN